MLRNKSRPQTLAPSLLILGDAFFAVNEHVSQKAFARSAREGTHARGQPLAAAALLQLRTLLQHTKPAPLRAMPQASQPLCEWSSAEQLY